HVMSHHLHCLFFFPGPATPATYTLSLHDALPIYIVQRDATGDPDEQRSNGQRQERVHLELDYQYNDDGDPDRGDDEGLRVKFKIDRKSTRLNSSHVSISYAVFCLKKKRNDQTSQK